MKIDCIELYHLELPLVQPIETKLGAWHTWETVLVRMLSGDAEGWGEASPGNAPIFYSESAATVFHIIHKHLAPRIVGKYIQTPDQLAELLEPVVGNPHARAAVDCAWWDLFARRQNQPLHRVLDGKHQELTLGVSFDRMPTIEDLLRAIGEAFEAGFSRVELKLRPGWDASMLNIVRREFPTQNIHADVEGALGLQHMELLCRMDDFFLTMLEQPLPPEDLVGMAMVQDTIRTPLGLDEAIFSLRQAELALELKSGRYVQIKLGQLGGITTAVKVHDACQEATTPCWVGTMPDSGVGTRAAYAVASLDNCAFPTGYLLAHQRPAVSLVPLPEPIRLAADQPAVIRLWTEPGIGATPDPETLARYCIAQAAIRP